MRKLALVLALVLGAPACGDGGTESAPTSQRGEELVAQIASYELTVGEGNRLIVGLLTGDNRFVSGGDVTFRMRFLDEGSAGEVVSEHEATFLHIEEPGSGTPPDRPTTGGVAEVGRGVYSAAPISFDRPGTWQVEVAAEVDGSPRSARAAFSVLEEPFVPAPGEDAPRTENLVVGDADAPPAAIDSRAGEGAEVPDPELHATTIAQGIEEGRPILAVFATPVYCVSRFCGPITDMVQELAARYGDRASFVHVEIWRDFDGQVVNRAAADWVLGPDGGVTEPWIFLIDDEGKVAARWDNVATPEEIEPLLSALPKA